MKWSDLPLRPTARMLRQFAVAWLLVFLCLAAHQYFVRRHPAPGLVLGFAAVLVGAAGWFKPMSIRWLFVGATVLAFPIGWLVSQLMLVVMYYVVLTPIALILRLRGRDVLHRRRSAECDTYWEPKKSAPDAGRYLKQY